MNSLIGPTVPESMIPDDLKKIFKGDQYELAFVCSEYGSATDEVNAQQMCIRDRFCSIHFAESLFKHTLENL